MLLAASCAVPIRAYTRETGYTLRIIRTDGNELIAELQVAANDEFSLHYTHSVSNTPVSGEFRITPEGRIQPTVTRFVAFGPGLPWTPGTEHRTDEAGRMVHAHDEDPRDELLLWVSELTAETITLGDEVVRLYRRGGAYDRIAIRVAAR